ncbi:flagellar biosynthetic protein FliR [Lacibacterium aquatile]|uniref:Flagellar biosynthetic protein FliR n=1 Tax=Lacibacterium aquatile TaxID=1168082 RepID=A0ABW5DS45_9PROT
MLSGLLEAELYAYILVFARMGGALMLLPGFGERVVPERSRLLLALAVTLAITPMIANRLPSIPAGIGPLVITLVSELLVGIFLGAIGRLVFNTLDMAGSFILGQIGLSSATALNPLMADQGATISVMLMLAASVIIMQTDLHILLLRGLIDSYALFDPARPWPLGDYTAAYVRTFSQVFEIALRMTAPFIIATMVLYVGLALIARLMPQLQVFFIALPLQIGLGFIVLIAVIPAIMIAFTDELGQLWRALVQPGVGP